MAHAATAHDDHGHPTGWKRFVYSTNHKDIGTMYLWFAILAGCIGMLLSVAMRWELAEPGIQYFHGLASFVYGAEGDAAVDAAYLPSGGKKAYASDAERVAFLFDLYQRITSLLPADVNKSRSQKTTKK